VKINKTKLYYPPHNEIVPSAFAVNLFFPFKSIQITGKYKISRQKLSAHRHLPVTSSSAGTAKSWHVKYVTTSKTSECYFVTASKKQKRQLVYFQ
jgi:hypothetical protein